MHIFLNVAAAIEVARHAVAYMRAHHGGGIVNVSSTAARKGMAHEYIDYAASKAAIETFTLGLADELAPEGIRVNAVRLSLIETGIHAKGGVPDTALPNSPIRHRWAAQVPRKRWPKRSFGCCQMRPATPHAAFWMSQAVGENRGTTSGSLAKDCIPKGRMT